MPLDAREASTQVEDIETVNYLQIICSDNSHVFGDVGSDRCMCGQKTRGDYAHIDINAHCDWTGRDADQDEEEETKWQMRAHMGEIEAEIKTLRDTIAIFGVSNLAMGAAIFGMILYVSSR